jgi:competence protein ComEC
MRHAIRWLLPIFLLAGCADGPPPRPGARADPEPDSAAPLELRFLDVGQGDATLLRGSGRTVLVDAGPSDRIVARLRELGVRSIDLLVASHNHADHIGGMDAVLDSFPVRSFLDNGHPATTRIQERVLERVEAKGVAYLRATPRAISLGDARLRVIPAPEGVGGDEQNNRSVSLLVERGDFQALLTGDSEVELLNALLERSPPPDVEVLKAAHHGSRNGVTPAWLARTRPEVVVVSVGEDNAYGHPHPAALRYFCAGGRRVFRTDQAGDVVVRVAPAGGYEIGSAEARACDGGG